MIALEQIDYADALFESAYVHDLPKGQIINIFDDGYLYMVRQGYIKRYLITREGEEAVQSIYGAGEIFPLTAVMSHLYDLDISNERKQYYYQAMTPVSAARIPLSSLDEALEEEPRLYGRLLREAATRLRANIQKLDNQSLKSVRWRLAHQLVFLAGQFGTTTQDGICIDFTLTQADLASMLNISRETVSRVMGRLQNQGYVRIIDKQLLLPSVERLQAMYR